MKYKNRSNKHRESLKLTFGEQLKHFSVFSLNKPTLLVKKQK
jgi:hypothetical protein